MKLPLRERVVRPLYGFIHAQQMITRGYNVATLVHRAEYKIYDCIKTQWVWYAATACPLGGVLARSPVRRRGREKFLD